MPRRGSLQEHAIDRLVGARIRARRCYLGMSQKALARRLGVTHQQLAKYENGINRIGAGTLFQLARDLAVPVSAFFPDVSEGGGQDSS